MCFVFKKKNLHFGQLTEMNTAHCNKLQCMICFELYQIVSVVSIQKIKQFKIATIHLLDQQEIDTELSNFTHFRFRIQIRKRNPNTPFLNFLFKITNIKFIMHIAAKITGKIREGDEEERVRLTIIERGDCRAQSLLLFFCSGILSGDSKGEGDVLGFLVGF